MITRSRKLIYCSVAAIFLLVIISGCAQSRSAIKDGGAEMAASNSVAVIQAIKVSSDASQVEVQTDKPLSYTYYKTIEPPKVVIDIAQAVPGSVPNTIEVNAGNIKRIDVAKHEFTGGILSRIEIIPVKELGDFSVTTDSVDKGKLLVAFAKSPIAENPAAESNVETKPVSATENEIKPKEAQLQSEAPVVKDEAKTLPVVDASTKSATQQSPGVASEIKQEEKQPAGVNGKEAPPAEEPKIASALQPKVLSAVTVGDEGIEITVGGGVDIFNAFKLNKPDRIVLDLPGIKNNIIAKSIAINKFGVGKARLGNYPGKVRIVLDANKNSLTSYQVTKSINGLKVTFSESSAKKIEKYGSEPVKEAVAAPVETNKLQPVAETGTAAVSAVQSNPISTQQTKVLNSVNANNDGIEIAVNGGIDTFNAFKLTKPDRIVLDLPGVKTSVAAKPIAINKFGVGQARVGSYPDKVRIVLDAARDIIPAHKLVKGAYGLKVLFGSAAVNSSEKTEKELNKNAEGTPAGDKKAGKLSESVVDAIDFSVVGEYSQISLKFGGACSVGKIAHVTNGLALTIHNCQVPSKFQRTIDTNSFPSVVQKIIPYQVKVKKGNEARILVKLRQKVSDTYLKPDGNTVLWNIKNPENVKMAKGATRHAKEAYDDEEASSGPGVAHREKVVQIGEAEYSQDKQHAAGLRPGEKKIYTGRRVSLEFSDADIRKILQLIAEVSNLNFLIGDDVSGTISIKLVNVPWDQALDVILETKGLEKRQDGNIMYIKPKGKFITEDQVESEATKEREKRMELKTKIFDVNFAAIADIAAQFGKIKSDRGVISQDARTNRVIVTDIDDRLEKMLTLLKALDTPEKQVMIEARIIEASSTFTRDLGVKWGIHYQDPSGSLLGMQSVDVGLGGVITPPPAPGHIITNLVGGQAGMTFGTLASTVQLDLVLSASATVGQIKIISSPKVLTLNNKTAKISQGTQIPYISQTAEQITTIFVEAALTLEVTPHVAADGTISMKIKATNDSAGAETANAGPQINKKEATTEVQVMNGETIVIGGIFQDSDNQSDSGVPFLMDIPLLGWLFKSNNVNKTKTELLIFITPKLAT